MKRPIHQITCRATLGVATLALTALGGSAASVRGAAVVPPVAPQQPTSDNLDDLRHQHQDQNEYGEEDEDQDRHTPSVAPTAINDMFAQDLANSADELPELWEEQEQISDSRTPQLSPSPQKTSRANAIDLPPQEATLSAAAASLSLGSAGTAATSTSGSVMPPISASPPSSRRPRSPNTIQDHSTSTSSFAEGAQPVQTYNNTSLPNEFGGAMAAADYYDPDLHHGEDGDAPADDLDAIMMGTSSKNDQTSMSTSEEHWSSTTPGTSRAQLDKSPQVEEAEARFEENRRIAAKLQAAAEQARTQEDEEKERRSRQSAKQSALEEMKSRSSKNTKASAAYPQGQHKYGLNVRLGQRAAPAQTVYVGPSGDFDTLPAAIHAGALNIIVEEGTHVVDSTIVLGQHQAGISIRGVSKTKPSIIKFVGKESAIVIFNSHNIVLSNLVVDAMDSKNLDRSEKGYDGQMWQVIGVVNSSQVGIIDCTIRSPSSMHAIFFAG